jgi:hypothetical protein
MVNVTTLRDRVQQHEDNAIPSLDNQFRNVWLPEFVAAIQQDRVPEQRTNNNGEADDE